MSNTQLSNPAQVHQVHDREALLNALSIADSGDTIVIGKEGDYGHISIVNKLGLLIKSKSKQVVIQASLSIDGISSKIIIENLNIWNDNKSKRQIIIIGKQSKDIIIRHCMLSSFPVSMNTLRDKISGEPKNWINGIRILGDKCDVNNNILVNVKLGVQGNGAGSVIQHNVIQYFSEDAIRVQQHGVKVLSNHIYDSVLSHPGETGYRDAILLIPPENRDRAGELKDIEVIGNVVRSQSRNTMIPKHMQGVLQGITGDDGYFIDITIASNTLVLNSSQGIAFNGAHNLNIADNKVIAAPSYQQLTPGIKLYLTRVSKAHSQSQQWLMGKSYSAHYSNNQAPHFNLPTEGYEAFDLGHNHFTKTTQELASCQNPDIIRDELAETTPRTLATPPPLFNAGRMKKGAVSSASNANNASKESGDNKKLTKNAEKNAKIQVAKNRAVKATKRSRVEVSAVETKALRKQRSAPVASSLAPRLHRVSNANELAEAVQTAGQGDTILILRAGNYGIVRITNKSKLRIKSFNTDIPIQASFVIDGSSHLILLENMQLWNNDLSRRYIIISGKSTTSILVRNCILSTVALNRNTMHSGYAGNPQQWISGIRMLGSNGQIISNFLMNLRMGVLESGPNTLIQHNLVQFYSEDGIRVSHHGVKVLHNNIYDSVAAHPGQSAHKDAIQLIPPSDHFNGGKLINVQIVGNIIQSYTYPSVVPANQRGIVQGIFGSDGYFVNTLITGNTVMVNSDHGITLNGVKNLQLTDNRIFDLSTGNHFNPGIKLYLTRISQQGGQKWLANRSYSVSMQSNQAPILNIPSEAYTTQDLGGNHYGDKTYHLARGHHPVIIRQSNNGTTESSIPVLMDPIRVGHSGAAVSVFTVTNRGELERAIKKAGSGDTIVFKESGHYGLIRLTHKTGIRLRASDPTVAINANFLIDGTSKNIIIENLNIWFSERNWKPVILTGPSTTNITIRNCLISSYQVMRSRARDKMIGSPQNWITGIWLRGHGNEIKNNHIVNVQVGIVANGENVLIHNNLIQYYSAVGIRIINNSMEITHNNIYDAIAENVSSRRLLTGIQLIPSENRFDGGVIKSIKITNNVIQAKNSGSSTADNRQGRLQGITMYDGYSSSMVINSNTIVVNTEHGITLNGVSGLSLNGNKVFNSKPEESFVPGIKLYYTRTIDIQGDHQQTWLTSRDYSVSFSNNQAAHFNVPSSRYEAIDGGGNQFNRVSHDRARGVRPVFAP